MQRILNKTRKAIAKYNMIDNNDHIVVGISGGKDSLLLLKILSIYQKFSEQKFDLTAVTIDLGFAETSQDEMHFLKEYINNLGINYIIERTEIAKILFEDRQEKSPCSLCSKLRRGALNTKAIELGANKLALGHHSDDILQTFLLSLIYESRLSIFQPTAYMDRTKITLIRPFIFVSEKEIISSATRHKLPTVFNVCPADKLTQREYMNKLVDNINKDIPGAKSRMISAITHPERNNLWQIKNKEH